MEKTTRCAMKKNAIIIILLGVFIFAGIRVFNHMDAWLGIAIIIASIVFIIHKITNCLKTKENEKDSI